ncbi:MAG: peptidyl-prolyl cis-trans isomerase [Candidatus Schekmanbacteria bacterium]|nr:peptidyl-prolyl cis-trans isomerase [Candidatus Schekmanbacteria bacterium]
MNRRVVRDPFVWFALLGVALFVGGGRGAGGRVDTSDSSGLPRELPGVLAPGDAELATLYSAREGRPPGTAELAGERDDWLDEEVLFQQAIQLELHRDDIVVRRRLVQRLTFLLQGASGIEEATAEDLRAWFLEHRDRYRTPARYSFSHRFFSTDHSATRKRAEQARALLLSGASVAALDDPFFGAESYAAADVREITGIFGDTFAARLQKLPLGQWSTPISSSYGLHIVLLDRVEPPSDPDPAAIRDRLAADWRDERQRVRLRSALDQLRVARGLPPRSAP